MASLSIVAAFPSYSADTDGVFIGRDTVRNLFETDGGERPPYSIRGLRFTLLCMGMLPTALVWRVHVAKLGIERWLLERAGFLVLGAMAVKTDICEPAVDMLQCARHVSTTWPRRVAWVRFMMRLG